MFFLISREFSDTFPCQWRAGDFCINTDSGWDSCVVNGTTVIFKGYCEQGALKDRLYSILSESSPTHPGNFCIIAVNDTLKIFHDCYRSFPIYISDSGITNLYRSNKVIWANSMISVDRDLTVTERKFNVIGHIDPTELSRQQVVSAIMSRLDARTQKFLDHNTLPVKVFLSGGIDSLLVYSFLKKYTNNYELVKCQHIDYDMFWMKNSSAIQQNWGYTQLHHWVSPCVLSSGAPGDEFMLRNPVIAAKFLKSHGENISTLLESPPWNSGMHYEFFKRDNYQQAFASLGEQTKFGGSTILSLSDVVVNDWQHWHIGNTLTWTPLRDLEIFKLLLRLPVSAALGQIFNSEISKDIIEQNSPGLTDLLSSQKNHENPMANLTEFLLKS